MEEETKKASNRISIIFLGLAVLIIIIGLILLLTNTGKKDSGKGNAEKDDPKKQNNVVIDGFTY